ncbi:MAG: hypothetical protein ACK4SL_02935 [Candidatus Paceibacteria bacterium]
MNESANVSFSQGAKVTYGSHGICTVGETKTEKVFGENIRMVTLHLGTGNIIKVPEAKAKSLLVPVSAVSHLAEVLAILSRPAKAKPPNWLHTEKKYASSLGTSDPSLLATLVRDLHPGDKPLGTELVQLYRTGLYQLVQLLETTEASDASIILKQMSEASGLLFREEDARPSIYVAKSRGKQVKPPTPLEDAMMMVKLPKPRAVRALPQPAPAAKSVVKMPVAPKAPPAPKPPVTPVVKEVVKPPLIPPAKPTVPPPAQPKAMTPQAPTPAPSPPPVVVAPPPKVEPVRRAVVSPPVKRVEPPVAQQPVVVDESGLRLENQLLRHKLSTLEREKKALVVVAARVENLETRLQHVEATNQVLRNQLSTKDHEVAAANRRRQQIDREQYERETYQIERIKQLGELVGVLFATGQLLAAALHEKMIAPPVVQTVVGPSNSGGPVAEDMKGELRQARRIGTLRKRRIDTLERKLATTLKDLKAANRTIVSQAAMLADNVVAGLLEALDDKKKEIDALSVLVEEKTKEVNRLNTLVQKRDETIAALREQVLTDKQLQDEIEAVRVDLFQYIFERTEAVERLQAYIRELQERSMQ